MADVIEDLDSILRRAITYLTRVLFDLCRRLNENSHRPLNRRTLVRWLAAFMPGPKEPKLRLQSNLAMAGNPTLDRWASCGSLTSAFSSASVHHLLEEDLGDNIVRYRRGCGDEEFSAELFEEPSFLPHSKLPDCLALTSTPKFFCPSSNCSVTSGDVAPKDKFLEMEEELAALRKQIAMLVMAQESSAFSQTVTEAPPRPRNTFKPAVLPLSITPWLASLDDSGCESEVVSRKPDLASILEHPPNHASALPPPPPPTLLKRSSSDNIPLSEQLQQRKRSLSSFEGRRKPCKERENVPDMVTVLKDLANVKLRAIERSPGGTPLRRLPEREPTDPASIIAQALKKKFSCHWPVSSESDKENDSSFASDHSSSFGQHLITKARKKLTMLDTSESWTPVSSPLKV
uniref:Mitochondrial fission regulator 2 n=1 Tax=Arion vulgaris TaxID=1028688 RepID=A0A0B7APB6_9EUPU